MPTPCNRVCTTHEAPPQPRACDHSPCISLLPLTAPQELAAAMAAGRLPEHQAQQGWAQAQAARRAADMSSLGASSAVEVKHLPPTPVDPKSLAKAFR